MVVGEVAAIAEVGTAAAAGEERPGGTGAVENNSRASKAPPPTTDKQKRRRGILRTRGPAIPALVRAPPIQAIHPVHPTPVAILPILPRARPTTTRPPVGTLLLRQPPRKSKTTRPAMARPTP